MLPAVVTFGVGLGLLVLLVVVALRPARRLARAGAALRLGTVTRLAALRALRGSRAGGRE